MTEGILEMSHLRKVIEWVFPGGVSCLLPQDGLLLLLLTFGEATNIPPNSAQVLVVSSPVSLMLIEHNYSQNDSLIYSGMKSCHNSIIV